MTWVPANYSGDFAYSNIFTVLAEGLGVVVLKTSAPWGMTSGECAEWGGGGGLDFVCIVAGDLNPEWCSRVG